MNNNLENITPETKNTKNEYNEHRSIPKKPLTLSQATKQLEIKLLKEYVSTLTPEAKEMFINTSLNLHPDVIGQLRQT